MLVPDKFAAEALGLSRSTLRTRRARGRLTRRGAKPLPTERLGERQHALVDTREACRPLDTPRFYTRHPIGLTAWRDPRGRLRGATKAEREAFARERGGCGCDYCHALSQPAEPGAEDLAAARQRGFESEDTDEDLERRERERVL